MFEDEEWISKKSLNNGVRIVLPLLGCITLYAIINTYVRFFTYDGEIYSAFAVLGIVGGIYCGQYIALLWASKNNKIPNILFLILPVISLIGLFFTFLFVDGLSHHPKQPFFISFLSISMIGMSLSTGMLVKLIRTKIQRQLNLAETQASHSEGELQLLQSQLSPHFLFNTLNNMYGISMTQTDKIPNLLLRLVELLRYSVYDTKALFVPLRDELAYIKNYVEFERIRIGNKLVLTQNLDENSIDHLRIAPMLLIVFIENAFKHSRNFTDGPIFIDIVLKQWGRSILFSVKNSVGQPLDTMSAEVNRGGLGLPNVWRRLELIYPDKYDLNIQEDADSYEVLLRLNL